MRVETLEKPRNAGNVWENEARPKGAGHTSRPLTHSLELSKEGLAVNATHETAPCIIWQGDEKKYQTEAAVALIDVGREPSHFAWITPTCGTLHCIEPEHLKVQAPVKLAYPYGLCIYCGRSGWTKDHLLPRHWSGDVRRHWVAIVPACGLCNRLLSDTLTWAITERRAICYARLRKHYRKVFKTKMFTREELDEFGPTLRPYIEAEMEKRQAVERIFDWPTDPAFDERALEHSGIEDPYAIGLILPDDADLEEMVRNVA